MEQLKKAFYAFIGFGDLAAEKSRSAFERARTFGKNGPQETAEAFDGLATRGEHAIGRIQRSRPAKRAVDGTKQATRQLKGAFTSIRKAVGLEETKATARKAS
jgi:hypothetical protein